MKNMSPLVLEISSDEEAEFVDTYGDIWDDFGYGFLSKVMDDMKVQSLKPSAKVVDDDDDDDCVVLDGDPDEAMVIVNGSVDADDSNDLEIIGQKGEVACRDFPHARHLCVKFAFASTPHEVHCSQCHCFVCDSLAPCSQWGTGTSNVDHCHASDKDEQWLSKRKSMQKADNKPAQVTTPSISGTPNVVDQSISHQRAQSFALEWPRVNGASPNNRRARGSQFLRTLPRKRNHSRQTPLTNLRYGLNRRNSVLPSQIQDMVYPEPPRRRKHSKRSSRRLIREPIHRQSQTPSRPLVNASFVNQQPHQIIHEY